jgi:prolyl-tRNA editing enzyme YbaK/EbsC (Cys-tRNA(Pro) deacylase)
VYALLVMIPAIGNGWQAGASKVSITPKDPLWMAGYAARKQPSQGVSQELYAKALVLQDSSENVAVLVTTDLLGFPASFVQRIADRVAASTGLTRDQMLFNASHTHAGPALAKTLHIAYEMTDEQWAQVAEYTRQLEDKLVKLIQSAMQTLQPVHVNFGETKASFAVNRRVSTETGYVIGANRAGPVDHRVPFLTVDTEQGKLFAVVFSYACHCTTLQGNNYHFHGDYAGVAQGWLEQRHPDSTALFVTGTAGDANPYPRGTRALAEEHGTELARAVDQAMTGPLKPIHPRLRTVFDIAQLEFKAPPSKEEFTKRLGEDNPYRRKHAQHYLDLLTKTGKIPDEYPFSIQIWNLGKDVLLVALAGEVVVDYGIRLKRELPEYDLWVAGYSNDVFAYIPSVRILEEGGYEAEDSMIYYGQPGPFSPTVEDTIVLKVKELTKRLEMEMSTHEQ